MKKSYSRDIAQIIHDWLLSDDWCFSFDEERGVFRFGMSLPGKLRNISCFVVVNDSSFLSYAFSPLAADVNDVVCMAEVADYVCLANYGLKNGNFELDIRDGEIRYKCFVDCEDMLPSFEIVKHNILCPIAMFERYGVGFADIICGGATAKESIVKCEGRVDFDPDQ